MGANFVRCKSIARIHCLCLSVSEYYIHESVKSNVVVTIVSTTCKELFVFTMKLSKY